MPGGKGKQVAAIALSLLAELARPLLKVNAGLVVGLIPESCPDKELLAKYFCSNWNWGYVAVACLEKGGRAMVQVQ